MTYIEEPHESWMGPIDIPPRHLDGVPWFEAPIPRRLHRCRAQTIAWVSLRKIERCACGAIRLDGISPWMERNSSRKDKQYPVPDTPYMERKRAEIAERDRQQAEMMKWLETP